jgi:hypothetical protein
MIEEGYPIIHHFVVKFFDTMRQLGESIKVDFTHKPRAVTM